MRHARTKSPLDLASGDVIIYPFLWAWEDRKGLCLGQKRRPCVVLLRAEDDVVLLPMTSRIADLNRDQYPVPAEELLLAGIDHTRGAAIGLNDFNVDSIHASVHMPVDVVVRKFSAAFMVDLIDKFTETIREKRALQVVRVTPEHQEAECSSPVEAVPEP